MSQQKDAEQIIKKVFDETNQALKTSNQGSASGQGTMLDWRQVIKKVFDPVTGTLKVSEG